MPHPVDRVGLNSFACEFGDRRRTPDSIEGHAEACSAKGLALSLADLGCGTFWQLGWPIEPYVIRCVSATLLASRVPPTAVNHIVFATMDKNLCQLGELFTRTVLGDLGLVNCVPTLISMQHCVSSLAALAHARHLFADPDVNHVIVVVFDLVEDADRIKSFALFGDAVTSCMMSRGDVTGLALLSSAVNIDYSGLSGSDNFESRKQVVVSALQQALRLGGTRLDEVEKCFSTNFYKPIALFNAGICGIHRSRLVIDTLPTRAHCGNCDWMINLAHYGGRIGFARGKKYLVQSYAPGFSACALLESPR
jgi:3-oxoacyl-[acyl-carrier-protein] synthase III